MVFRKIFAMRNPLPEKFRTSKNVLKLLKKHLYEVKFKKIKILQNPSRQLPNY